MNAYQMRCAKELGHGAVSIKWERGQRLDGLLCFIERPAAGKMPAYVDVYWMPRRHFQPPRWERSEYIGAPE